ncbi:hypothetical protein P5G50_07190 [Leifsonia sp. F6_8S_P_1B]|uniref:Uncharacterized protein n=1 Tax=Leifsonia williamsii TaxID=3035919 RepID=A0ABT8KBQ8_9MICO|nr:hypothetical protein [Leifsonia williamsii]MDN4614236.1 hypothetical protein [Leifsonia williamsii]
MGDMTLIEQGLRELLTAERGLRELLDDEPEWYPALLRQLQLAVGDERIIYLGASAASGVATVTLRVGVFTDRMVIATEVFDGGDGDPQVVTRVESRASLLRFELHGGSEAEGAPDAWPGGFRIRAFYRSGLTVSVPANVVDTEAKRVSVHAVLDGIRADLVAGSALSAPAEGADESGVTLSE